MNSPLTDQQPATLDPPGAIVVIGAGPVGLEAALYGRFLGYDVTVLEAERVAHSVVACAEAEPEAGIPMLPDRCASPLVKSALQAQSSERPQTSPQLMREWADQVWLPLAESDLLRGRVKHPAKVTRLDLVDVEPEGGDEAVPPDFRIHLEDAAPIEAEAVIIAVGSAKIECSFGPEVDYLYRLAIDSNLGDADAQFLGALKQIVSIFATLGGRDDLDLYRPLRM